MTAKQTLIVMGMLAAAVVLLPACSGAETAVPGPTPTKTLLRQAPTPTPLETQVAAEPTPTPTLAGQSENPATPEPPESPCAGLSGQIEVQVLVGPADAVGLEPLAVGVLPFSTVGTEEPFVIQGGGDISYAEVLVEDWGTYEVTLDLHADIGGECAIGPEGPALQMAINMSGQQMVEVEADRFQGEYPWSGEVSLDLSFPVTDGATAQGEGWVLILHLDRP
jgi:hypothetical protein